MDKRGESEGVIGIIVLVAIVLVIWGIGSLNRSESVNKQANIEKNPQEKYQIYSSDKLTFLLDKTTGQTWRYFRKFDQNNNLTDDGWEAFLFDQLGSKGSTPEEAEEMYRESVSSNATK